MESLEFYLIAADNPIGKKQRLRKRKRSGEELTREQVKAIKKGRKLLRKEMRRQGLKEKSDFELTASNMGLYFDKPRWLLWLPWFFHGRGLWMLLAALLLLLAALFLYSTVTKLRGHFTINMTDDLFREGFVLSETEDFKNPTTHLFCTPAEDVPCISITDLPKDLDDVDGQHNANYFAYTFYCRNEGQSTVDYEWQVNLNSESKSLASACWVMLFEDGEMQFYAKPNGQTGKKEALPSYGDNSRGYIGRPMEEFSKSPEKQYETIALGRNFNYERVIPFPFVDEEIITMGTRRGMYPRQVHKYTVVVWLEGDDPDCTDELIGGHVGIDFQFRMIEEQEVIEDFRTLWETFWEDLKFWGQ